MSYAHMDHAAWVESNNAAANSLYAKRRAHKPAPEKLSPFQAKVMDICGMVGGGIYNAPINWEKVEWGVSERWPMMIVPWRDGRMSTFDFYPLTMLVLLCHEARIRCEIRAKCAGHFELMFSQRMHEGGWPPATPTSMRRWRHSANTCRRTTASSTGPRHQPRRRWNSDADHQQVPQSFSWHP
jgi:hypothetical protein